MTKKIVAAIAFSLCATVAMAQLKNPVKWDYTAKKINGTTYELHLTATIDPGWHMYTIDHKADIGVATTVTFNANPLGKTEGAMKVVGKAVSIKDPSTGELVKFYENRVELVQTVKLKAPVKTSWGGTVEFMVCDDKQCLPPTEKPFTIQLK